MNCREECAVLYVHIQDCKKSVQKEHSQKSITIDNIELSDLDIDSKLIARKCEVVILQIGKQSKLLKSRY